MVHFSLETQKELLQRWGYRLKEIKETQAFSVYHNDIEYEDYKVKGVFDQYGEAVCKPTGHYHRITEADWVGAAFSHVFNDKFLDWVKNSLG